MDPNCLRGHKRSALCAMLIHTPKDKQIGVLKTNGGNLSAAMRFSRYAQNYNKSKPPPDDVCVNGHLVSRLVENKDWLQQQQQQQKPDCNNPIFSKTWISKVNIPQCGCSPGVA
jgi:hypothetical protein